ncbi:hypothetical protein OVA24_06415 [Luteolibacter sp. SL250]|uniref:hypothetical protein n=1 Tax=Luteolibacter sp. SL250 TaxID=2995170 RepID=UPI00226E1DDD|nr:hypothetical protein [Luteolibacter sp. SL250]WAC21015.1 hypothetical protein OVA24_06415 [Luteolibacter sp. SL250]
MKRITLHGGPCDNRTIRDIGTVAIRMSIADQWIGKRPVIGARCGLAIYEPTPCRTRAHWLTNVWQGRIVAIID